ncbi:hypothetical protein [Methylomonas fluvii]|uniref:DUF4386 family protein n=1 Tax=Methylomonas fluvii TaxID=1854564 RepID=A0ABR9DJ13_9GAMM|nr:hypothetical protein [Methylomonas fluvii]MBD9363047.1 hypothetical protein [Methylomonas fluvii]CAD6876267.1 hypothetical protein [Methylomonas fluvii]
MHIFEKLGGIAIIVGSLLLSAYAVLFPIFLPLGTRSFDYVEMVRNSAWVPLALVAFAGVLALLVGFYAVYAKMRNTAGVQGAVGFLFVEAAYLLQVCKVTWELFLYPVIARYPETAFLLRDAIIKNDPAVLAFRISASATILIGIVLFCLAIYRSAIYPKPAAALIFIGAVVYALGPMISVYVSIVGIFTFAVGCMLLGVRLLR